MHPLSSTDTQIETLTMPSSQKIFSYQDLQDIRRFEETSGIKFHEKISVRWIVTRTFEDDDKEETEEDELVWWTASISLPTVKEEHMGERVLLLHYESFMEFEAATSKVIFNNSSKVYHIEQKEWLKFRNAGETAAETEECPDSDDEFDNPNHVISVKEIIDAQNETDREEAGSDFSSAEMAMLQAFDSLPFSQQMMLGSVYRQFADEFKNWLHVQLRDKGNDFVVTENDIKEFLLHYNPKD
ncbi:hypothetical protein IE077_000659 [Cardiosporidium cionae]|uniref:Uncharacterized protein n=1 Tax=Cardiosporidium cionae TaxID=476202 RepID=A0ABQ7J746_9APIC|nr:hypothetical protein IE077_000659 [Cardiosporidium cionae]|eukprot:KAF8819749.1 hypothetical protein IE077_000659 [Cardiosporidium cionae]